MTAFSNHAVYTPIRAQTAFDETCGRLVTAIRLGLLEPGSRLPAERELCIRLGISRSTLRQALSTLTAAGYLHATRGRGGGTFVVDRLPPAPAPTEHQLSAWRAVCDERLAIELGVIALAAQRATDAGIERLDRIAARMSQAGGDVRAYRAADRRFHVAIAETTDSSNLIVSTTRNQGALAELLAYAEDLGDDRSEKSDAEHLALVSALRAKDVSAAVSIMCAHVCATNELLEQRLGRRKTL